MSNAASVNGLAGAGAGIVAQIISYPLQAVLFSSHSFPYFHYLPYLLYNNNFINLTSSSSSVRFVLFCSAPQVNTRQRTERLAKKNGPNSSGGSTIIQIYQVLINEGIGGLYSGLKPSLLGTAASQGVYYYFYQIFKNKAQAIAAANKRKGRGNGSVGKISWLLVAALAGCLNVFITAPIWILVTRMQTHTQAERKILERKREALLKEAGENGLSGSLQEKLAEIDSMKLQPYGTFDAMREVYKEAGIPGFWKGLLPALIMVSNPTLQFMIYESSLKHLKSKHSRAVKALEVFILGAMAKLGATVATYPLLVIRARLQAKQEIGTNATMRYSGTIDAISKMIRYEGLRSFYKGISTKIVQSVLAAAVLFMIKEEFVKAFSLFLRRRQSLPLKINQQK